MFRALCSILLILCLSSVSLAFELTRETSVPQIWAQAVKLSGSKEDMALRSLMFHKLYLDSNRKLPFALSVSHLTLAIERSLDFGSVDEMHLLVPFSQTLKRDTRTWRNALQSMNQDMFRKTYLAYQIGKYIALFGSNPSEFSNADEKIKSISSILPTMVEMHRAHSFSDFSQEDIDRQFNTLVTWEHAELFQPQLEATYDELHWLMKTNLRHIPGAFLEKYLLEPIFNLRSTLSLQCFIDPNKKLMTADFLNAQQRIEQARQFFKELQKIHFDPALFCYNDEYYLSQFESEFFVDTNFYLSKIALQALHGSIPKVADQNKLSGIAKSFSTKLSPTRVFTKMFGQCKVNDLEFWKTYPLNLLDFPQNLLMSHQTSARSAVAGLEMGVAKNALINRAYVELFLIHGQNESNKQTPIIPFSWLGSAVFGSNSVGQELLYGMLYIFKSFFPDQVIQQFSTEDLEKVKTYMDGYSAVYAVVPEFMKTLATANQAVFVDIYWQFFVAELCGVDKVVDLLEKSEETTDRESLDGWLLLQDQKLKDGNLALLRVEQEFVLQPLLYSGFSATYFSYRKIFNRYAKPGAPGPDGPLMPFDDYASELGFANNLAFLESRMIWVNYLVESHALYFQQQNQQGQLVNTFADITRVYSKILRYYENSVTSSNATE